MPARRFPPPWVEDIDAAFVVSLAISYGEDR